MNCRSFKRNANNGTIFLLFVIVFVYQLFATLAVDYDLTLTHSQKVTLDKFKERVIDKLPHEYMKTDFYLIRWLKARNFNINQAEQMLDKNIKWRRDYKIDTILEEDWSLFNAQYPCFLDTMAKDGNPILTSNFGDWDIRGAALSGRMRQLTRYVDKTFELALTTIRRFREEGKNVTQTQFFVNMDHYSVAQQGCLSCMTFHLSLITTYENYYPLFCDHIIFINVPPIFQLVLQAVRPIMSPTTKESLKVYGQNKSLWRNKLLEIVDESQLPSEFGGTLIRKQAK